MGGSFGLSGPYPSGRIIMQNGTTQPISAERAAELPQIVARRQKRLKYWHTHFAATLDHLHPERIPDVREKLNTFGLLLSKLVKAENESQLDESEDRLKGLERELTSLFESARLMTAPLGIPSIE